MVVYTDGFVAARRTGFYPTCLLVLMLLYIFLKDFSFEPLLAADFFGNPILDETYLTHTGEGSLVNQIFWLTMFAAALPLIWRHPRPFFVLMRANLPLLLVIGFAALSVGWAIEPGISFRRFAKFAMIVLIVAAIVASLPEPYRFARAVLVATAVTASLSVLVAVVLPHLAWNFAGEFVGVFRNKNTAGQFGMIMAVFWFFAFLDADGTVNRAIGGGFTLLALTIIALTISKTVWAILPLAVPFALVMWWATSFGPKMVLLVLIALLLVILSATVPFWLVNPFAVIGALYNDPTLTGRTEIWSFLTGEIANSPMIGHGYESFWNLGSASPAMQSHNWLLQFVNQGHNGYLDTILHLGYIGLVLVMVMVVVPFFQLAQLARRHGGHGFTATMATFSAMLTVVLLHNVTESSFLRIEHPVWLFTLFAILYISAAGATARPGRNSG